MKKETDLESVKRIAKGLLNVSVLETEYSPMIVSHPFAKCGIVVVPYDDDYFQLNITKPDDFNRWKTVMAEQIDDSINARHVYYLLNDSYVLMFVNHAADVLSKEDFNDLLGEAWVKSECANEDANVSKKEVLKLFKKADKNLLMSASEKATFKRMDDSFVVYRGVAEGDKQSTEALSWTTSFGQAKWFAERWGNGSVYAATVDKQDVLAYFDRKGEDEVVVDYSKLQNVRVVNKPQPKPEPKAMQ